MTITRGSSRAGQSFKPTNQPGHPRAPYLIPDLPPYFIPREPLTEAKEMLLARPAATLAPLTLHGPSGAGKTALAIALAHDSDVMRTFPHGVLWASLGPDGSVQAVQQKWAEALKRDLQHIPDTPARAAALRTLLRKARVLLIIDDVTSVDQVKALNVGGPNCARIITTDADDEIVYGFKSRRFPVGHLDEEEALSLLAEWAGMLSDVYLPTIREIVRRLSYSALTLSLVGAQARQGITWLRLLEILRESQGPLASLNLDAAVTRQQSLGIVTDLVLSRFGQAQLQRSTLLTAFAPGISAPFSARAAAACWELSTGDARTKLATLVEASLVFQLPDDYYAIHPALHAELRRAAEPAALREAVERVRAYYFGLIEQSSPGHLRIDAQHRQIVAAFKAIAGDDMIDGERFAEALMRHYENRGLWGDYSQLAERLVSAAREGDDHFREHLYLGDLGYAQNVMGQYEEAHASFERSLTISRELGDPAGEATALNNLGAIFERRGMYDEALRHYEQSFAIHERLGARNDAAEALNNVAGVLYWQEDWNEALNAFQRALDIYTLTGERLGQAKTLLNIGAAYERLGRDDEAGQSYQRALAIYTNQGSDAGQAQALNNLGIIHFNLGRNQQALSHFEQSLGLKEELGDQPGTASTLNNIALVYEKTGNPSRALEYYERSYQILDMLEDPRAHVVAENINTLQQQLRELR
jgi:tetratricopeptide (TPR) repeat protein